MRNVYLIAYDVADAKRLRKVHKKMCGHGDPLQYSVFRCELSPIERQILQEDLWPLLNLKQDRVMLVDLGPAGSRGNECIEFWGTPRVTPATGTARHSVTPVENGDWLGVFYAVPVPLFQLPVSGSLLFVGG